MITNNFTKGVVSFFLKPLSALFLFSGLVNAQPTSQTFNASGTYTVPSGYSANVTIEAWGAGGGGGTNSSGAKGGGGGGAYASLTTTLVAGSYIVTVGTGGGAATAGTNSSFTTIVIAEGGFSTTGTTGGAGGTTAGSTGTVLVAGAAGANTSANNGGAGGAGANGGGAGGTGGVANNGSGAAGTAPGGGGGGKAGPGNSGVSGAGAAGRVIVTVNFVLPVKFYSIRAIEKQNGLQIEWTVSSEENLSRYQVERSSNGSFFTAIGDVAARNVTVETKYGFFDSSPLPGVSFYRLKSIDIDSKYGYSSIVRVSFDKQIKNISLYPNPATGDYVSFEGANLTKGHYLVRVFNSSGAQVFDQNFSHSGGAINQTLKLPVGIQSGLYLLQLSNDGVKVMNKTFMIQ